MIHQGITISAHRAAEQNCHIACIFGKASLLVWVEPLCTKNLMITQVWILALLYTHQLKTHDSFAVNPLASDQPRRNWPQFTTVHGFLPCCVKQQHGRKPWSFFTRPVICSRHRNPRLCWEPVMAAALWNDVNRAEIATCKQTPTGIEMAEWCRGLGSKQCGWFNWLASWT